MAKAKSRDEKRLEGYRQFTTIKKLEKVFDKNMVVLLEKNIQKILHKFNTEAADIVLRRLKDDYENKTYPGYEDDYENENFRENKYYKQNPRNLKKHLEELNNTVFEFQQKKLNAIEDKFNTYYKIINKIFEDIAKAMYKQDEERRFSSICIKNFKGFSDKNKEKDNTLPIKPITLIYGPNSYGKSSIIQALLLLYQTVTEEFDFKSVTLKLNGNFVNLGTFNDLVNKSAKEKEFRIELSLPYRNYNAYESNIIITEFTIGYNFTVEKSQSKEVEQIILSKIDISKKEININSPGIPRFKIPVYEFIQSKEDDNHYDVYVYGENTGQSICKQSFFALEYFGYNYDFEEDYNVFKYVDDAIRNILYISSFRNPPERYYIPEYSIRKYVGKNGENTREILVSDSGVRKKVSYWLKEITGYTLSEENNKDNSISSINLDDNTTEIKNINLVDLGSGVAQVLPIITQSFITQEKVKTKKLDVCFHQFNNELEKQEGSMVLIEEPEIHLHPRAQAELGSMFADAIKVTNNTFIIETHSENLLLRLEKLIRKGELSKDDVSVIYVHKDKDGSHCIPLELDDEGGIVNIKEIPGGFFEESYNELFGG